MFTTKELICDNMLHDTLRLFPQQIHPIEQFRLHPLDLEGRNICSRLYRKSTTYLKVCKQSQTLLQRFLCIGNNTENLDAFLFLGCLSSPQYYYLLPSLGFLANQWESIFRDRCDDTFSVLHTLPCGIDEHIIRSGVLLVFISTITMAVNPDHDFWLSFLHFMLADA